MTERVSAPKLIYPKTNEELLQLFIDQANRKKLNKVKIIPRFSHIVPKLAMNKIINNFFPLSTAKYNS